MHAGRVDADVVRRLASYESDEAPVVSFYLNLDPREFALEASRPE